MDLLDTLLFVPSLVSGTGQVLDGTVSFCPTCCSLCDFSFKVKRGFLSLMLIVTKKWQKKTFPNSNPTPPPIPFNKESKIRKDNKSRNLCVCVEQNQPGCPSPSHAKAPHGLFAISGYFFRALRLQLQQLKASVILPVHPISEETGIFSYPLWQKHSDKCGTKCRFIASPRIPKLVQDIPDIKTQAAHLHP